MFGARNNCYIISTEHLPVRGRVSPRFRRWRSFRRQAHVHKSSHIAINPLTTAGPLCRGAGSIELLLRYQRANPMGVYGGNSRDGGGVLRRRTTPALVEILCKKIKPERGREREREERERHSNRLTRRLAVSRRDSNVTPASVFPPLRDQSPSLHR